MDKDAMHNMHATRVHNYTLEQPTPTKVRVPDHPYEGALAPISKSESISEVSESTFTLSGWVSNPSQLDEPPGFPLTDIPSQFSGEILEKMLDTIWTDGLNSVSTLNSVVSSNLEVRLMRQESMGEGETLLYNLYDGDTVIGGIFFTLYPAGDGPYGKEEGRGPYIHVNAINVEERYRTTDGFMKLVNLLIPYRQQGYEVGAAYTNPRLQQVINQWLQRHSATKIQEEPPMARKIDEGALEYDNEQNWTQAQYYAFSEGGSYAGKIRFDINSYKKIVYVEILIVEEPFQKTDTFMQLISTLLPYRQQGYVIKASYINDRLMQVMNQWLVRHSAALPYVMHTLSEGPQNYSYTASDGQRKHSVGYIGFGVDQDRREVYVDEVWVRDDYRNTDLFMQFISKITPFIQQGYTVDAHYLNPRLKEVVEKWMGRHSKIESEDQSPLYEIDDTVKLFSSTENSGRGVWLEGIVYDIMILNMFGKPTADTGDMWYWYEVDFVGRGRDTVREDWIEPGHLHDDVPGEITLPEAWGKSGWRLGGADIQFSKNYDGAERVQIGNAVLDYRIEKGDPEVNHEEWDRIVGVAGPYLLPHSPPEPYIWIEWFAHSTYDSGGSLMVEQDRWAVLRLLNYIRGLNLPVYADVVNKKLLQTLERFKVSGWKTSMGLKGDLPEGIKFFITDIEPGDIQDEPMMEHGGYLCKAILNGDEIGFLMTNLDGVIFYTQVLGRFTRRGVATAMVKYMREAGYTVIHDWRNLSPDAEQWAPTVGSLEKEGAPLLTLEPVETGGLYFDYTGRVVSKLPDDSHMPGVTQEIWNVDHGRKPVGSIVIEHKPQGSRVEEMFILPDYRNTNAMMLLATPVIKLRNQGTYFFDPDFENQRLKELYERRYSAWKFSVNVEIRQVQPGEDHYNWHGNLEDDYIEKVDPKRPWFNAYVDGQLAGSIWLAIRETGMVDIPQLYVAEQYRTTNVFQELTNFAKTFIAKGGYTLNPPYFDNPRLKRVYEQWSQRNSMALPPDVLKRHPYFYHVTEKENLEAIRKNGIWPASVLGESKDDGFWKPRPNHTYLFTDVDQAYESGRYQSGIRPVVLSINTAYLDPQYLKADEDYLYGVEWMPGDYFHDYEEDEEGEPLNTHGYPEYGEPPSPYDWQPGRASLGEWAQERRLDDENVTEDSLERHRTLAYEGPIPPAAISLNAGWNEETPLPAPSKPLPHPDQLQMETATIELPPEPVEESQVMRRGQPVLFYPNLDLLAVGALSSSRHALVDQQLKREGIIPQDEIHGYFQEDLFVKPDTYYDIPAHWGISMEHDLTDPQVIRMVQLMKEHKDLPVFQATKQVVASFKDLKRI